MPSNSNRAASRDESCSVVAKRAGQDPIGSAWSVKTDVLVELPLPFAANVLESRGVPDGLPALITDLYEHDPGIGFIGIAPDARWSRPGLRRVIIYSARERPVARASREEYLVPEATVTPFLRARLIENAPPPPGVETVTDDFAGRDLLVCTHSTVDACCATFGFPFYRALRRLATARSDSFCVWRCTHFGGHQFAPTMLELPDARYWGYLTAEIAEAIVDRSREPDALRSNYRGWAGHPWPEAQLLEREAFTREGWDWIDWPQEAEILESVMTTVRYGEFEYPREDVSRLRIRAYPPDGHRIVYEGRVEVTGELTIPLSCGDEPHTVKHHRIANLVRTEGHAEVALAR